MTKLVKITVGLRSNKIKLWQLQDNHFFCGGTLQFSCMGSIKLVLFTLQQTLSHMVKRKCGQSIKIIWPVVHLKLYLSLMLTPNGNILRWSLRAHLPQSQPLSDREWPAARRHRETLPFPGSPGLSGPRACFSCWRDTCRRHIWNLYWCPQVSKHKRHKHRGWRYFAKCDS